MKMSKRVFTVAIVGIMTIMIAALAGCGNKEKQEKSDLDYVKDKGTLIIGLDDTFAPMGFRDKKDKLVGLDIDLANAVAKELGVKVKFQPIDWEAKEAELKSKKIDCIWNGMSATPEREKSMSLSKRYLKNRILVMSLKKNVNVKSDADLKNYKMGTQAGSAALEAIKKNKKYDEFKGNIKEYDTYDRAIMDMKAGRNEVLAIDEVFAIYNSAKKEKLYASDFNFGADYYAVGFRKDDKKLTEAFNKALKATIDSGKAAKISKKWFGKNLIVFEDKK